jgi:hypothetical protein
MASGETLHTLKLQRKTADQGINAIVFDKAGSKGCSSD